MIPLMSGGGGGGGGGGAAGELSFAEALHARLGVTGDAGPAAASGVMALAGDLPVTTVRWLASGGARAIAAVALDAASVRDAEAHEADPDRWPFGSLGDRARAATSLLDIAASGGGLNGGGGGAGGADAGELARAAVLLAGTAELRVGHALVGHVLDHPYFQNGQTGSAEALAPVRALLEERKDATAKYVAVLREIVPKFEEMIRSGQAGSDADVADLLARLGRAAALAGGSANLQWRTANLTWRLASLLRHRGGGGGAAPGAVARFVEQLQPQVRSPHFRRWLAAAASEPGDLPTGAGVALVGTQALKRRDPQRLDRPFTGSAGRPE